jgi:hypothetical protein
MAYTDASIMPFGKHSGTRLEDVPAQYLLWLWDNGVHEYAGKHSEESKNPGLKKGYIQDKINLADYIRSNFAALETEASDYIVQHPASS